MKLSFIWNLLLIWKVDFIFHEHFPVTSVFLPKVWVIYIEMTPETSSTTLIFSSRDSKFSFWALFGIFESKHEKSFSPHFEEFYYRHFKPSLSSLGQTSWSCSSNELIFDHFGLFFDSFWSIFEFSNHKMKKNRPLLRNFIAVILSHHWAL